MKGGDIILPFLHAGMYLRCSLKRTPPSKKGRRYGMRARVIFSTLTRFEKNTCNIYIFK